jgi:hypothetical protein
MEPANRDAVAQVAPEAAPAESLSYARKGRVRHPGYYWRRRLLMFCAVAGVIGLEEWGFDKGSGVQVCTRCGAHGHVRHVSFFGLDWQYGQQWAEGPISTFIQSATGKCTHRWSIGYDTEGGLLLSVRTCTVTGGWWSLLVRTELAPDLDLLLRDKARANPRFVTDLVRAVGAMSQSNDFFDKLYSEAMDRYLASNDATTKSANP